MEDNIFKMDTGKPAKRDFLKRIGALFGIAVFLSGFCSLGGIYTMIKGIQEQIWKTEGAAGFTQSIFLTVVMVLVFGSLVKMAVDEKPFSVTLTWCIRLMGALFLIASVVMPRMQGYEPSGFRIISSGDFVLIDGFILLPGLLLIILGRIIKTGFDMQRELDEIL